MKQFINTNNAPQPIGPYSQGIKARGSMIFVSGQIPLFPDGTLAGNDIVSQTHQSLKNVKAVLEEAGATLDNVVKVTVLMKNLGDFATMNEVYDEYFSLSKPARAAYEVSKLPKDVLIEIEAIAVVE